MNPNVNPITAQTVFSLLPPRARQSHKGTYGTLLAICGSSAFRGSAVLACGGALRSGAGIVCLAAVEPVLSALMAKHSECTLLPLPMQAHGGIDAAGSEELLRARLGGATAVLVGCGMGNTSDTEAIVRLILRDTACPILVDADGLNALSAQADFPELLRAAKGGVILTPHVGEMARLTRLSIAQIKADPEAVAARFAAEWGCVVVLKDAVTHVASPGGEVYRNTTGNPGLARGGSGDVLAGMIASFAAQGLCPTDAALCGVWLHGAAADDCAARLSVTGMLPSDLVDGLCNVFRENGR